CLRFTPPQWSTWPWTACICTGWEDPVIGFLRNLRRRRHKADPLRRDDVEFGIRGRSRMPHGQNCRNYDDPYSQAVRSEFGSDFSAWRHERETSDLAAILPTPRRIGLTGQVPSGSGKKISPVRRVSGR